MIPNTPKELNYSKIRTYRCCPFLFKLKYVESKREGLIAATSFGVSMHRTLEEYHARSNNPDELEKYFNRNWLGGGYTSASEQMEYYLKGLRCLEDYAKEERERKSKVLATEREFIFEHKGWTFRGKIDRIDQLPDGSFEVIDYKTDAQIEEDFNLKNSLQLGIYSLGARRAWNMQKGKAVILFVSLSKRVEADFDSFSEEEILNAFIETGEKIERQLFIPDTSFCPLCLMKNKCPHSTAKTRQNTQPAEKENE